MMHLATAANEAYAPGLQAMVVSALHSLSLSEKVIFHILDGGLTSASREQLQTLCKKNHQCCKVAFYHIDQQKFQHWRLGPNRSLMTYARLLLGSLVKAEKVIYLDADLIVLGDLYELWNAPMQGMVLLGCCGLETSKLGDDSPWQLLPGEEKLPYLNGGLLIFDLNQWRLQKMEEQAMALLSNRMMFYRFHDQTVLNYLLRHQVGVLPLIWNWQRKIATSEEASSIKIIHFITSRKPWFFWSGDIRSKLWRSFYQTYIGSTVNFFLSKRGSYSLLYGIFENQIRRYSWLRAAYVRYLIIACALRKPGLLLETAKIRKHYYTRGLGGELGSGEFEKNKPLLRILLKRMKC